MPSVRRPALALLAALVPACPGDPADDATTSASTTAGPGSTGLPPATTGAPGGDDEPAGRAVVGVAAADQRAVGELPAVGRGLHDRRPGP